MKKSFEYLRNEYCHKILEATYQNASPEARELTYSQLVYGEEGKLLSNEFFVAISIDTIRNKINKDQGFIQECCELLAFNDHISKGDRTNKGIFLRVRFTKAGVLAFKTEYYLKANKQQDQIDELHKSTVLNNRLTPLIAAATLFVGLAALLKDCTYSKPHTPPPRSNKDTINVKLVSCETQTEKTHDVRQSKSSDMTSKLTPKDSILP